MVETPYVSHCPDTDTTIKEHNKVRKEESDTNLQFFTDKSNIDGRVGAAAWCPRRKKVAKVNICTSEQFMVYGAELVGIGRALHLAIKASRGLQKVTIFTNNQASILSIAQPRNLRTSLANAC
jgi:hypothetical protein